MSRIKLIESLQGDVKDIKGLINFDEYGLTLGEIKKIAEGVIGNLEDNLEELIKLTNKK